VQNFRKKSLQTEEEPALRGHRPAANSNPYLAATLKAFSVGSPRVQAARSIISQRPNMPKR